MDLKIKIQEEPIEVEEKIPFKNCQLNRVNYAKALKSVVVCIPEGGVIALDGAWGTGKTTFIKMWAQYMHEEHYKVLYFNAWETDFISDPLIGLIGEFKKMDLPRPGIRKFKTLVRAGRKMLRGVVPTLVQAVITSFGWSVTASIARMITSEAISLTGKMSKYDAKSESINEFKESLRELIEELDPQKPLIFIVDELDRCNPHYAVKVLERIKHLFTLSRIVFVLCIDKEQLGHSICGYYGSEQLNSGEYLRRFIDIEYKLPNPDFDAFFKYLYKDLDFDDFIFKNGHSVKDISNQEQLSCTVKHLFMSVKPSLRMIKKMLNHARLAVETYSVTEDFRVGLFFLLLFLRFFKSDIYEKINSRKYEIQDLVNDLETLPQVVFKTENDDNTTVEIRNITFIVTELLVEYCYDGKNYHPEKLYTISGTADIKLKFRCSVMDEKILKEAFPQYGNEGKHNREWSIGDIVKHIEMHYTVN